MRGKHLVSVFILVALVFLSGCVEEGGEEQPITGGLGVVITKFQPDMPEVYAQDSVTLELEVTNFGEAPAENISATLYNYNPFTVEGNSQPSLGSIDPKPAQGKPYTADAFWTLKAPSDIRMRIPVDVGVRVTYTYHTEATARYLVIGAEEYKRRTMENLPIPEYYSVCWQNVPVKVDARELLIKVRSGENRTFPVTIEVEDVGAGRVMNYAGEDGYLQKIELEYPDGVNATKDCDFNCSVGGNLCVLSSNVPEEKEKLRLAGYKRRVYKCTFNVTNPGIMNTFDFDIRVYYKYAVDKLTHVEIVPFE